MKQTNKNPYIEHELRVLEIDSKEIEEKIKTLGGKLIKKQNFRRYVFDCIPAQSGKWLRLRTDGELTTLTFKSIENDSVDGTSEWEVTVDDFDKTYEILSKSGFKHKGYQENKRTEYALADAKVAIDSWPLIPTYLEIEAEDKQTILNCAKVLGFTVKDLVGINNQKIYAQYGINLDTIPLLKF